MDNNQEYHETSAAPGEDNEALLAEKRRRAAAPVNAGQLRARMRDSRGSGTQPQSAQDTAAQPQTAQRTAAQPQSAQRGSAQPQSVQRTAAQPQTAQRTAAQPQSAQRTVAQPQSAQRTSAQPQTVQHTAAQLQSTQRTAAQPQTVQHTAAQTQSTQRTAAQPQSAHRTAAQPQSAQRGSAQPQSVQRTAAQPQSTQRTSAQPQTVQHTAAQPQSAQRTAAQPQSAQGTAAQPQTAQRTAAKPQTAQRGSASATVHSAETPRATVPPAMIPYQQASVTPARLRRDVGAPTRVTDITHSTSAADAAATQLSSIRTPVPKRTSEETEEPEESEGGNTLISLLKAITYIVAVIVISVFLSVFIILVGNDIYAFVKDTAAVEITVPEYATLNDVSTILAENNIIKYPKIFKLYAEFKKDDGQFLAGTYSLTPSMNYDELLASFKPRKPSGTSRITIPEGYTTDEIIDLLVSRGIGTREGYVDVINNYDFDYWFLDELEENGIPEGRFYRLDGYLFPDTYEFYNASSEEVVIDRLLKRFNQVFVSSYAQKAKELGYTVDQMLIIASLIEKEAGSPAEFFDISSVFNNRLRRPALYPCLESDATIVYAIQHDTGVRVNLTGADLSYDSPYNTYTHQGLPPGPIANPSASAIRAALYPADTDYYYFVAASSTRSLFAKTKEEHEENIRRVMSGKVAEETSAPGLD